MRKCKVDGCLAKVWSGDTCRRHTSYKSLKAKPISQEKKEEIEKMREFFLSIWKKRKHVSEISGEKLNSFPSSAYFHHILYKESVREAMYDENNIILLTIDEHSNVHSNPDRYEEINRRRKLLLEKYRNNNKYDF